MNHIINVDDDFAKQIGFTSDKFIGYLWRDNERIIISAIMAINPRQGHFTELINAIENLKFKVTVPNPSWQMKVYLAKRNFVPRRELDRTLEKIEVWERSPVYLGVERQPKPKEIWRHFKGNEYHIINVSNSVWIPGDPIVSYWAKDSETEEVLGVYHHDYGVTLCKEDGVDTIPEPHVIYRPSDWSIIWARKLDNFLEVIEQPNKYRFEKISKS